MKVSVLNICVNFDVVSKKFNCYVMISMVDDVIYEQVEKHRPNYTALDNAASDRTWRGVAGIDAYSLKSRYW